MEGDGLAVAQLSGHRRNRRLLVRAAKLRARVLPHRHAFEAGEEIEMPPVAVELSVGDRREADRLLLRYDVADGVFLERPILAPARLGEPARAQQAAYLIGTKRRTHHQEHQKQGQTTFYFPPAGRKKRGLSGSVPECLNANIGAA